MFSIFSGAARRKPGNAGIRRSGAISRKYYLMGDKTPFALREAYRTLRTNILSILSVHKNDSEAACFSFTSPRMGDGKTTVCANTSIAMAEMGAKVLIIDADMRKPKMHKIFKTPASPGLSDCLSGFVDAESAIVKYPEVEGLYVLPAGKIPPNPAELILSGNFDSLITSLKDIYDYVIIDAPPVCVVTDAVIISKKTLGAIIVCRYGDTRTENAKRAKNEIEQGGGKILGSVLNGVEYKRAFGKSRYKDDYGYYDSAYEENL